MAVLTHDTHERTKIGADFRYGCWNRPAKFKSVCKSKFTGEMWFHKMSHECRFDLSITDPGCTDCIHRGSGERYDKMVREHGN